jgi:short-subunit dehydrogenase
LGASRVETIVFDLAQSEAPRQVCSQLEAAALSIDYLINNAGFGTTGCFDRLPLEREIEELEVNINAVVALTRLLLPQMVARHGGTIINVASTAAFQPVPYMTTYAATKAFVLSFTEGLAGELIDSGIRVLALCPGPVKTEFQDVANNHKSLMPDFVYVSPEKVVADALAAAASGRTVYIAGALNFVSAEMTRFAPRALIRSIARRIYRPSAEK